MSYQLEGITGKSDIQKKMTDDVIFQLWDVSKMVSGLQNMHDSYDQSNDVIRQGVSLL